MTTFIAAYSFKLKQWAAKKSIIVTIVTSNYGSTPLHLFKYARINVAELKSVQLLSLMGHLVSCGIIDIEEVCFSC